MANDQSAEQHSPEQERAEAAPGTDNEATATAQQPASEEAEAAAGSAEADQDADGPEAEIARLNEELEAARAQADDYWQRYVRAEAEKENIRKRAEKDADNARKQGMEKLANELLSVRDSLELGVDAANQEDADVPKIREGTELTLKMLVQAMDKCGIEEINPVGEKFDPEYHQAMSMQEAEDQESNTVVSVVQKGYRVGDRLLRPAMVMVAK